MLSLIDVGYVGHLQWDRISNSLTDWVNLYGAGTLGMGNKIYSWDGNKFTETTCSTLVPWFGKLMRMSKLRVGVIRRQYFGVTSDMVKALLGVW